MPIGSKEDLRCIIEGHQLTPVFQPIFDLNIGKVMGFEALIRGPANSPLYSPLVLFQSASEYGYLVALDNACREVACRNYRDLRLPGRLFLNVIPLSLFDHGFGNFIHGLIDRYQLSPDSVVLEISERYPIDDYKLVKDAIFKYRDAGFRFAIDDLGVGYSGLRIWNEIHPEYIKIDRHFIQNVNEDKSKRDFVHYINEISIGMGCRVIAEGIEADAELSALKSLNVNFGQGYLLGKASTVPNVEIPANVNLFSNSSTTLIRRNMSSSVMELLDYAPPISNDTLLEEVADIFEHNSDLPSIPVVRDEIPIGMVLRNDLLELFLGRYGRDLYAKRPVQEHMISDPIIVDESTSLEDISRKITSQPDIDIGTDFIITRGGKYLGVGKVRRLLKKITDNQVRYARYSNPLTLLPGSVPLHEKMDQLLVDKVTFRVAYLDINDFKPFNDIYGYGAGDKIILLLADVIQQCIDKSMDMVGHIGGDDFVILLQSKDWKRRCESILRRFEEERLKYYDHGAIQQGGIWSLDRRGEKQFFPLVTLAIGVAEPNPEYCMSHNDVSALASAAKQQAKQSSSSILFVSRRTKPTSIRIQEPRRINSGVK